MAIFCNFFVVPASASQADARCLISHSYPSRSFSRDCLAGLRARSSEAVHTARGRTETDALAALKQMQRRRTDEFGTRLTSLIDLSSIGVAAASQSLIRLPRPYHES